MRCCCMTVARVAAGCVPGGTQVRVVHGGCGPCGCTMWVLHGLVTLAGPTAKWVRKPGCLPSRPDRPLGPSARDGVTEAPDGPLGPSARVPIMPRPDCPCAGYLAVSLGTVLPGKTVSLPGKTVSLPGKTVSLTAKLASLTAILGQIPAILGEQGPRRPARGSARDRHWSQGGGPAASR